MFVTHKGVRVSELEEMKAEELDGNDYIVVSDMFDRKTEGKVTKKMKVSEFVRYLKERMYVR